MTGIDELRRLASEDLSSTVLRLHLDRADSVAEEREIDALTSLLKGNLATSGGAGAFILDRSRLAIAAHLQTALVLDDELVHSDSARLNWFRERLRSSVRQHCHQVIVFTCRPGDYLSADAQAEDDSVAVVDLVAQLAG